MERKPLCQYPIIFIWFFMSAKAPSVPAEARAKP